MMVATDVKNCIYSVFVLIKCFNAILDIHDIRINY